MVDVPELRSSRSLCSSPQSRNGPLRTYVYVNEGFFATAASRWAWVVILSANTGRGLASGLERSEPNSEGRKRFTPAATAASIRRLWPWRPGAPTQETTASMFWVWRALVRDVTEVKSTGRMVTEVGSSGVDLDAARVRTVMLNLLDLIRTSRTGRPRAPDAPTKATFLMILMVKRI